ncbi:MAG: ORF6N domain-containing protein [Akkermansiaceae bacterium]|nr:ORF6N domain-containing protein [Akkermansiaceae bacterium]MCF7731899.1 ORF6N domain-containing protein [Akkermansiaceae bacterium]
MNLVHLLDPLILNLRGQMLLVDAGVVTICDHLSRLEFSKSLPYAFTEHGALMAANVLNSPEAVRMDRWLQPASPSHQRRLPASLKLRRPRKPGLHLRSKWQ